MSYRCAVPSCNSGRAKGKDKFSLFVPPANPELLKQWEQNIPNLDRPLTRKDSVCARHFEKHLLNDRYYSEIRGNVLLDIKKVPRLRKGAVPTIFDGSNGTHMEDANPPAPHEQSSKEIDQPALVSDPQTCSTAGSCIKQHIDICNEGLIYYVKEKCEGENCLSVSTIQNAEFDCREQMGAHSGQLDIHIKAESNEQQCSNAGAIFRELRSPYNRGDAHNVQHGCHIKVKVEEQCMDGQNPDAVTSETCRVEHQREVEQPEQKMEKEIRLGVRVPCKVPNENCIRNMHRQLDMHCSQGDRCILSYCDGDPAAVSSACTFSQTAVAATTIAPQTAVIRATSVIPEMAVNTTCVIPQTPVNNVCTATQTAVNTTSAIFLEHLVRHPEVVKLPFTWSYHKVRAPSGNRVVYSTMGVSSNGTTPVVTKFINITECRKGKPLEVFIMNRSVEDALGAAGQPSTIEGFVHMVELVDTVPICRGGPTRQKYPDVLPERAKLDCLDVWRHDKCSVYGTTQCPPCARLKGTLRSHNMRQKKRLRQAKDRTSACAEVQA